MSLNKFDHAQGYTVPGSHGAHSQSGTMPTMEVVPPNLDYNGSPHQQTAQGTSSASLDQFPSSIPQPIGFNKLATASQSLNKGQFSGSGGEQDNIQLPKIFVQNADKQGGGLTSGNLRKSLSRHANRPSVDGAGSASHQAGTFPLTSNLGTTQNFQQYNSHQGVQQANNQQQIQGAKQTGASSSGLNPQKFIHGNQPNHRILGVATIQQSQNLQKLKQKNQHPIQNQNHQKNQSFTGQSTQSTQAALESIYRKTFHNQSNSQGGGKQDVNTSFSQLGSKNGRSGATRSSRNPPDDDTILKIASFSNHSDNSKPVQQASQQTNNGTHTSNSKLFHQQQYEQASFQVAHKEGQKPKSRQLNIGHVYNKGQKMYINESGSRQDYGQQPGRSLGSKKRSDEVNAVNMSQDTNSKLDSHMTQQQKMGISRSIDLRENKYMKANPMDKQVLQLNKISGNTLQMNPNARLSHHESNNEFDDSLHMESKGRANTNNSDIDLHQLTADDGSIFKSRRREQHNPNSKSSIQQSIQQMDSKRKSGTYQQLHHNKLKEQIHQSRGTRNIQNGVIFKNTGGGAKGDGFPIYDRKYSTEDLRAPIAEISHSPTNQEGALQNNTKKYRDYLAVSNFSPQKRQILFTPNGVNQKQAQITQITQFYKQLYNIQATGNSPGQHPNEQSNLVRSLKDKIDKIQGKSEQQSGLGPDQTPSTLPSGKAHQSSHTPERSPMVEYNPNQQQSSQPQPLQQKEHTPFSEKYLKHGHHQAAGISPFTQHLHNMQGQIPSSLNLDNSMVQRGPKSGPQADQSNSNRLQRHLTDMMAPNNEITSISSRQQRDHSNDPSNKLQLKRNLNDELPESFEKDHKGQVRDSNKMALSHRGNERTNGQIPQPHQQTVHSSQYTLNQRQNRGKLSLGPLTQVDKKNMQDLKPISVKTYERQKHAGTDGLQIPMRKSQPEIQGVGSGMALEPSVKVEKPGAGSSETRENKFSKAQIIATIPGQSQPIQLLKYSAISRCGMVLKQYIMNSPEGDKSQSMNQQDQGGQQKTQAILTPKVNQDSFKVMKSFPKGTKQYNWLFGIFDGHGQHGDLISQHAAQVLPHNLNSELTPISQEYTTSLIHTVCKYGRQGKDQRHYQDKLDEIVRVRNEKTCQAMNRVFDETDKQLTSQFKENAQQVDQIELSGCTGSILLVQEDYFVISNVGDSPVIIFRDMDAGEDAARVRDSKNSKGPSSKSLRLVGEQLSLDHKPDLEEETNRIMNSNGVLDQFQSAVTGKKIGPLRVWSKDIRQPGLAMSRSLGDNLAKRCGVISVPTTRIVQRDRLRDRAILVCSDGITDQLSMEEMQDTLAHYYKFQDTENCCKQLVESATQLWVKKHNMQDDITAVVIFLR